MSNILKLAIIPIIALGIIFTFSAKSASAINKGLQISPVTFNFDINPGEKKSGKIIIKNNDQTDANYMLESENFTKVSDQGAPSFNGIPKQDGLTTLADWYTYAEPKEGILKPGQSKEINFTIAVPIGAEPGGHYAAIFAKVVNRTPEGDVQLGVSSRVGTLMLVSIPGEVKKSAVLSGFTIPKIIWSGPLNFSFKVQNTGTIHYDSTGTVEIKPTIGKTVQIDMGTHTIIPSNSRDFQGKWTKKYPFGLYKITASATDGNKLPMTAESTLWAIPLIIVIPSIVGLIILIILISYFRKHLKFQ